MSEVNTLEAEPRGLLLSERHQAMASEVGARAVIQLSEHVTFAHIISGLVPITAESIIYDRSGALIDAVDLQTFVQTGYQQASEF